MNGLFDEPEVFGEQIFSLVAVVLSSIFWFYIFKKIDKKNLLKLISFPALFFLFWGSLDILATINGTYQNADLEANPLAKDFFDIVGYPFTVFIWISIWMINILLLNHGLTPLSQKVRNTLILTVMYSLALGHLYAFSGWVGWENIYYVGFTLNQTSPILNHMVFGIFYVSWMIQGFCLALTHLHIQKFDFI